MCLYAQSFDETLEGTGMSVAKRYLDYLDQHIGIAPAGTQEELDASQEIARVFEMHGLETKVQEFSTPAQNTFVLGVVKVLAFVALLIAGFHIPVVSIIFALVSLACVVCLALQYFGRPVFDKFGRRGRSQNVVGFHKGTGPEAIKGNRSIVIVAHYDTPQCDMLSEEKFAPYKQMIIKASVVATPLVAVSALIQALVFLPGILRTILWVCGLICALPILIWGVANVAQRFLGYSRGCNSNKSSLAAMFGVLENLRPTSQAVQKDFFAGTKEHVSRKLKPGVRHGKDLVQKMGILPQDTEIIYGDTEFGPEEQLAAAQQDASLIDVPQIPMADPQGNIEDEQQVQDASKDVKLYPVADNTPVISSEEASYDNVPVLDTLSVSDELEEPIPSDNNDAISSEVSTSEPSEEISSDATDVVADEQQSLFDAEEKHVSTEAEAQAPEPELEQQAQEPVSEEDALLQEVHSAARANDNANPPYLKLVSDDDVLEEPAPISEQDMAPASSLRSSLFDIPDPLQEDADPLSFGNTGVSAPVDQTAEIVSQEDTDSAQTERTQDVLPGAVHLDQSGVSQKELSARADQATPFADDIQVISPETQDSIAHDISGKKEKKSLFERLGLKKKKKDSEGPHYQGGVASAEQTDAPDDQQEPYVLGPDDLISHDIWFVASGSSAVDFAGTKMFLEENRKDIRGAFFINLDSIGAGQLSLLADEGFGTAHKADRRLVNELSSVAASQRIALEPISRSWENTDATCAMRESVRSATLMGVADGGLQAYAKTMDDTRENIDDDQIDDVVTLVTELIRRS